MDLNCPISLLGKYPRSLTQAELPYVFRVWWEGSGGARAARLEYMGLKELELVERTMVVGLLISEVGAALQMIVISVWTLPGNSRPIPGVVKDKS